MFSFGDWQFGIYSYDWGVDFRMPGVMVALTSTTVIVLFWKKWKRP